MDKVREQTGSISETAATPMAEAMAERLERWLQAEAFSTGQPLPAERDLAERLGASRSLVRAALDVLGKSGVIERQINCRPVYRGKTVKRVSSTTGRQSIAIWLFHHPGTPERAALIHGVRNSLDPDAYRVFVESPTFLSPEEMVASEQRFIERLVEERDIQGAIVWCLGGERSLPALKLARDHGIPLVFIDREPPAGFDADYVGVDNFESARQATRHLIDLGHERIAHITNSENVSSVIERRNGYRSAIETAGLEYREDFVVPFTGSLFNLQAEALEITRNLLALPSPPTAVFVVNDLYALGVLNALEEMNLSAPNDMAVVGFDGVDFLRPGPKTLTTAVQPFERIGSRAIDLLLRRMQGAESATYRQVLLEAPLSIHRSSRLPHSSQP